MHVFVCLCSCAVFSIAQEKYGFVECPVRRAARGGVARPPALQDFVILFPLLGRRGAEQDAEGGGHLPCVGQMVLA